MAKEYIEREALLKKLFPIGVVDNGNYTINAGAVLYAVKRVPAADVVEVVRCKDCKHYEAHQPIHKKVCEKNDGHLIPVNPDDFCSYGERKDDECPKI